MKKTSIFITAILLTGFTMSSCKKDSVTDPIVASSEDNAEVSAMFDDVDAEADNETQLKTEMITDSTTPTGTKNVFVTDSLGMKKTVITYDNFVNGKNNRIKNGKIIILTTGKYVITSAAFKRVITFDNFTINGNKIEGVRTIERNAIDSLSFDITLVNGKVTFMDDKTTYTRILENRVRKWTNGSETPYIVWDDEYDITGSANGTNRKGEPYKHEITSPIHVAAICPWIQSGVIEFSIISTSGTKTSTIDYGSGGCDNSAVINVNGKSYNITLKGSRK